MNEAQRKKFEEVWELYWRPSDPDVDEAIGKESAREICDSVLSVSDGWEHSQHKCGCEEVIKAYREVLQNVVDNKGAWWIEAKEVLTRMESHKLPEVK